MAAPAAQVAISTMHLAKGLEFRAVAVMACADEVVPPQARIEAVADDSDLEDVYKTERRLLYGGVHAGAGPAAGDGVRGGVGVSGGSYRVGVVFCGATPFKVRSRWDRERFT